MQRVEPGYLLLALCPQLTSLEGSGASGKGNGSIFLKCVVFVALLFLGLAAGAPLKNKEVGVTTAECSCWPKPGAKGYFKA